MLIEIHDTGIGLSPEDLADDQRAARLPPTVDVSVSRRMGLFVVGRLSLRHGIRIQLRPSDSGGTTALVMLPVDVAQGGKKPPGKPGQRRRRRRSGRRAGRRRCAAARRQASGRPAPAVGGPRRRCPGRRVGGLGAGARPGRGRLAGGQGRRAALPGRAAAAVRAAAGRPQQGRRSRPHAGPAGPRPVRRLRQPAPRALRPQGSRPAGSDAGQPTRPAGRVPGSSRRASSDAAAAGGRAAAAARRAAVRGPSCPAATRSRRTPSWGDENAQPPVPRAPLDAPRGHEEPDVAQTSRMPRIDDRQGPGATAEIPPCRGSTSRQGPAGPADFGRPVADGLHGTGQFPAVGSPGRHAGRRTPASSSARA